MLRTRLLLLLAGIILSALLFLLPKVVVDDEQGKSNISDQPKANEEEHNDHEDENFHGSEQKDISPEIRKEINNLTELLKNNSVKEKSATFADSIASIYHSLGMLDSVAKYRGLAADNFPNEENLEFAGLAYYEAFGYVTDDNKAKIFGDNVRAYLGEILENHPERLDLKTKIAMTYVSSQNPMQGILLLREVIESDPENEEALYNLGLLSRQSGQLDKAIERFSKIVAINPDHIQARFLLAVTYLDLGENNKAKEQFEIVKRTNDDPAVQATVDSYLEKIN